MFLSLLLFVIILIISFVFLRHKYSYFKTRMIPFLKPSWIVGNLNGIGTKYQLADKFIYIYEKFKNRDVIVGFYMLFSPVLLVVDPKLAQTITIKDFNFFTDRGVFHNEDHEILTRNLFSISGKKWKNLRNKLSPAFTKGKLKLMFDVISRKSDNLVDAIRRQSGSESIEMKKLAIRFTIDSIISCSCGLDCNTLNGENDEIIKISEKIFGSRGLGQLFIFFLFAFPETAKKLNMRQFDATIEKYFTSVISNTLNYRKSDSFCGANDLLNMLTQLMAKGRIEGEVSSEIHGLDFNDVVAQVFIMFFAGFETSATTISFTLAELAINQDVQEKLRAEILKKVDDSGKLSFESLHEMEYLSHVIDESLRMYPPVPLLIRKANADYQIEGSKHVILKGQQVIIPLVAFHYDARYWDEPKRFNPDRFATILNRKSESFVPFGNGPRNCIGGRFGLLLSKLAVARIVQNFKFSIDRTRTNVPLKLNPRSPLTEVDGGDWMFFEPIMKETQI